MKMLIGIVGLFLISAVQAQNCSSLQKRMSKATCSLENSLNLCRDFCTGKDIFIDSCAKATHCCVVNGSCVLKTGNFSFSNSVVNTIKIQPKLFQIGAPNFPPQLQLPPQFGCPKFPHNCMQGPVYGAPQEISPPVNIPYCQRIPCSPSLPSLENNQVACLSRPGCYFDNELNIIRQILGYSVLPGVPVCHLAIRNEVFQRKAAKVQQQLRSWTPYLTQCLIKEYRDEIYGESVGCEMLDLFEYFNHRPKLAGWPNIDQQSCRLINGCWKTINGGKHCVYPLRVNHFTVRSGNDEKSSSQNERNFYGLPTCMPFSSSLTGDKFLSSYHQCLSAGCAINVNPNDYWTNLYKPAANLPYYLQIQYYGMIANNKVRPDNFQSVIENLNRNPLYSNFLGLGNQNPNLQTGNSGFSNILPFQLKLNQSKLQKRSLSSLGTNNPYSPFNFPNFGIPSYPSFQPPCPYRYQPFPGLPSLKGSFEGCCDKPICFIPRRQLLRGYSGLSPYLSQWSNWGDCSAECGGGRKNRTRICINDFTPCGKDKSADGCDQHELTNQQHSCNTHICPYFGKWTQYSSCSKTCGGGIQSRSRVCHGQGKCKGYSLENIPCRTGECPRFEEGEWSPCLLPSNSNCGFGKQTRTSKCVYGGEYGCPADRKDEKNCQVICNSPTLPPFPPFTPGSTPFVLPPNCNTIECFCRYQPTLPFCPRSLNVGK